MDPVHENDSKNTKQDIARFFLEKKEDIEFFQSVIVLNAGGTINMGGLTERRPSASVNHILKRLQKKLEKQRIHVQEVTLFERPPDSSNIGSKEWKVIIKRVKEVLARKERARHELRKHGIMIEQGGIVITHGTDTMQESTLVLALELSQMNVSVPIVFTGSFTTISDPRTDAIDNLHKAIFAVKELFDDKNNLPPGIYLVIGDKIHLATRVSKIYTTPNSEGEYFFSFPSPIGRITRSSRTGHVDVKIDHGFLKDLQKTRGKSFPYKEKYSFGYVEHVIIDAFTPSSVMQDVYSRIKELQKKDLYRRYGVIIQGDFSRSPEFFEIINIIERLYEEHEVISFVGSRKTYERMHSMYQDGYQEKYYQEPMYLFHKSLSYTAARTKLSWLLKFQIPVRSIPDLMDTNFAGEIFSSETLPEWKNYETFMQNNKKDTYREVIKAFPDIDYRVFRDARKRLLANTMPKRELIVYGYGDGNIPTVNASIKELVIAFTKAHDLPFTETTQLQNIEAIIEALKQSIQHNFQEYYAFYQQHYQITNKDKLAEYVYYQVEQEHRDKQVLTAYQEMSEGNQRYQRFFYQGEKPDTTLLELFKKRYVRVAAPKLLLVPAKNVIRTLNSRFHVRLRTELPKRQAMKKLEGLLEREKTQEYLLQYFPEVLAKRIMKDALMEASKILFELGYMTDHGITVRIKTTAWKGETNLLMYEIGNMLYIIGAQGDKGKGWIYQYLANKHLKIKE